MNESEERGKQRGEDMVQAEETSWIHKRAGARVRVFGRAGTRRVNPVPASGALSRCVRLSLYPRLPALGRPPISTAEGRNQNIKFSRTFCTPSAEAQVATMDVVKAVETYITKMVSTPSSMKVLLLDNHTVRSLILASLTASTFPTYLCPNVDTYRVPLSHAVDSPVASSLSHGQD